TLPGDERSYAWELVLAGMAALSLLSFAAFVRAGFIRPPELRRETVLRGLAGAAKAPVKPFTMLRNPRVRRNGGSRSSATKRSQSKTG
ncbi:MAG: hypothetical protein OEZ14_15730, partial [Acidimicrobiia bacterium]|nr:hypothetical protein [Acidimicrobiia bacterium]